MSTYPAFASLGPANTGLAAQMRVKALAVDGAEIVAATGAGVEETTTPGDYTCPLGLADDFQGRVLWSPNGTNWLAEEGVDRGWEARLGRLARGLSGPAPTVPTDGLEPVILQQGKIWNAAPHNAFGDLIRFRGAYLACFREGATHASADGKMRVLRSRDFRTWESVALLEGPLDGLRDGHFCETAEGELLLSTVVYNAAGPTTHQAVLYRSWDGVEWTGPTNYGDPNVWAGWRLRRRDDVLYSMGYSLTPVSATPGPGFIRLYRSDDHGHSWTPVSDPVTGNYPNECELFWIGSTLYVLVRRDSAGLGYPTTALLLSASPPYTSWATVNLGKRFASPCVAQLRDGRWLAGGRFYSPNRMSLAWLDPIGGALTEAVELARDPDVAYPGLVVSGRVAWTVYYSAVGGQADIYGAEVAMPKL